jgi:hypothetical protein
MSPGLNPSPVRQIDVERLFGMPVDMTLVKDTKAVYNAIQAGTCVDPAVDLGKQYQQMAESGHSYICLNGARHAKAGIV